MNVWILTEEHNEYNQFGEYFVAVYKDKPTVQQLAKYVDSYYCTPEHVWSGGGRTDNNEDTWWYLREEVCE